MRLFVQRCALTAVRVLAIACALRICTICMVITYKYMLDIHVYV